MRGIISKSRTTNNNRRFPRTQIGVVYINSLPNIQNHLSTCTDCQWKCKLRSNWPTKEELYRKFLYCNGLQSALVEHVKIQIPGPHSKLEIRTSGSGAQVSTCFNKLQGDSEEPTRTENQCSVGWGDTLRPLPTHRLDNFKRYLVRSKVGVL